MITGQVTADREAVVRVRLRSGTGGAIEIDAVLDTGFTDSLALPPSLIAALRLPFLYSTTVTLADGSQSVLRVHRGTVQWEQAELRVLVHAADGGALVGMALLYGHQVNLQVVDGGSVTIERLPQLPRPSGPLLSPPRCAPIGPPAPDVLICRATQAPIREDRSYAVCQRQAAPGTND